MGRLRIPESWKLFLWNSESCVLESGSHLRLESEIQVPLTKNPESSCWNLESTAWNPESRTVLDSLIWGDTENTPFCDVEDSIRESSRILNLY